MYGSDSLIISTLMRNKGEAGTPRMDLKCNQGVLKEVLRWTRKENWLPASGDNLHSFFGHMMRSGKLEYVMSNRKVGGEAGEDKRDNAE